VIRVGPAGWSYADWEGRVYPSSKPEGFHPLAFLARFFDCIEVNSSFYAIPRAEHAAHWTQLVNHRPDFRFLVKLHREFTHGPEAKPGPALAAAFREGIEPLLRSKKLGALLAQFPASFTFGPEEVRRLGRIRSLFSDVATVLEVRHASWFTPPALDTIRGLRYSLAYVDLPPAWNHPPEWHPPTGPIGYLRLHGRNSDEWFRRDAGRDDKYDYLYTEAEVEVLAAKTKRIGSVHTETHVVTNNHFAGKAVANGLELRAVLLGEVVPAPGEIVDTYPRLASRVKIEGQQSLF
jgi:uncharacterized protein YecE (DUF72 family)